MDILIEVTNDGKTKKLYGYTPNDNDGTMNTIALLHAIAEGVTFDMEEWKEIEGADAQQRAIERAGYVSRYDETTKRIDFNTFHRRPRVKADDANAWLGPLVQLPKTVNLHECTLMEFREITPILLNPVGMYFDDDFCYTPA